jgi:hypothetical protein
MLLDPVYLEKAAVNEKRPNHREPRGTRGKEHRGDPSRLSVTLA